MVVYGTGFIKSYDYLDKLLQNRLNMQKDGLVALHTAYASPLTTHYPLLTTHYSLLTAYRPLPLSLDDPPQPT